MKTYAMKIAEKDKEIGTGQLRTIVVPVGPPTDKAITTNRISMFLTSKKPLLITEENKDGYNEAACPYYPDEKLFDFVFSCGMSHLSAGTFLWFDVENRRTRTMGSDVWFIVSIG